MDTEAEAALAAGFRLFHKNDTDENLRRTMLDNLRKGTVMADYASPDLKQSWITESRVCSEILAGCKDPSEDRSQKEINDTRALPTPPPGLCPIPHPIRGTLCSRWGAACNIAIFDWFLDDVCAILQVWFRVAFRVRITGQKYP